MSFIELSIILLISLGILDKDKLMKVYKFLTSNKQSIEIIGDKSIDEKWVWRIFLFEHRIQTQKRTIIHHFIGE